MSVDPPWPDRYGDPDTYYDHEVPRESREDQMGRLSDKARDDQ